MKIEHKQYDAINVLYLEMFSCMLSYAQIKLNDYSLAEEAVQESFGIACLKADQVKKIVLEQCTIKEVSQELEISFEACKKRIQRGKKRLEIIIRNSEEGGRI